MSVYLSIFYPPISIYPSTCLFSINLSSNSLSICLSILYPSISIYQSTCFFSLSYLSIFFFLQPPFFSLLIYRSHFICQRRGRVCLFEGLFLYLSIYSLLSLIPFSFSTYLSITPSLSFFHICFKGHMDV